MKKNYLLLVFCVGLLIHSCKKTDTANVNPTPEKPYSLTVKGRLKNCTGSDITYGLVVATLYRNSNIDDYAYSYDSVHQGSFSWSIKPGFIPDSVTVFGIDLANLKISDTLKYKLQDTLLDVSTLNVCASNVSEYFRYTVDTMQEVVYTPIYADSLNVSSWEYPDGTPMTSFKRKCYSNCKSIEFQFDGHSAGVFPVTGRDGIFIFNWYSFNMPNTGSITYINYGAVGQYVEGFMSVPFIDNTDSLNHLLTGSFRLKRKDHL